MKNIDSSTPKAAGALLLLTVLTISCAEAVPLAVSVSTETYGFWHGLLHGIILPFSFIGSLFDDSIAVYAINNTGGWYDFGFVFGASIIFGGSGKGSGWKKKKG